MESILRIEANMSPQEKLLQAQEARRANMAECGGSVTSGTVGYRIDEQLAKSERFWRRMCSPHPFR